MFGVARISRVYKIYEQVKAFAHLLLELITEVGRQERNVWTAMYFLFFPPPPEMRCLCSDDDAREIPLNLPSLLFLLLLLFFSSRLIDSAHCRPPTMAKERRKEGEKKRENGSNSPLPTSNFLFRGFSISRKKRKRKERERAPPPSAGVSALKICRIGTIRKCAVEGNSCESIFPFHSLLSLFLRQISVLTQSGKGWRERRKEKEKKKNEFSLFFSFPRPPCGKKEEKSFAAG